jgi:hypothetical protein
LGITAYTWALKFFRKLQLDFHLFLQPFLVGFLRIASLYFIFLIFILKKSEFWGITKNWVMTDMIE